MSDFMRAYHLLNSEHGLSNLRHKRLKIAQLKDLNDPFDLWALAQPNPQLRIALRMYRTQFAREFGLVCFSRNWHNPVLWGHYGDHHRGICLGFDLNPTKAQEVSYKRERPQLNQLDLATANNLLHVKFIDWKYEEEIRMFVSLTDRDPETSLYFVSFGGDCSLREVIVGPLSTITDQDLLNAMGTELSKKVKITKARLAFNSFEVVKDRRGFVNR
jgi:hypothetical protein